MGRCERRSLYGRTSGFWLLVEVFLGYRLVQKWCDLDQNWLCGGCFCIFFCDFVIFGIFTVEVCMVSCERRGLNGRTPSFWLVVDVLLGY
jgi:hypothetical protein